MLEKQIFFNIYDDYKLIELMFRMLKVKSEERLSLKEFNKEMIKESELLKDKSQYIMLDVERKEMLLNNDCVIEISPFELQLEYYLNNKRWKEIQNSLIQSYSNSKPKERVLLMILKMKLSKKDESLKNKLKFKIFHKCKFKKKCLDEMIFNIKNAGYSDDVIEIDSSCLCCCEMGVSYFFRILKQINSTKLKFYDINLPIQSQPLFGLCFSQLSDLQKLDLSGCSLSSLFFKSFVKSIPKIKKLNYVDLEDNPIGPEGFKLLFPHLHLLIRRNELDLCKMNLNDESVMLLISDNNNFLHFQQINVIGNNNISANGLKLLFNKFHFSRVICTYHGRIELLVDKDVPNYLPCMKLFSDLIMVEYKINDDIFIQFLSLRFEELHSVGRLFLSDNRLTYRSIYVLMNLISYMPNLSEILLDDNPIGDEGMKLLYRHLHLLIHNDHGDVLLKCTNMKLSSTGLKYLIKGLKRIDEDYIVLDVSDNNIDSNGMEYLMDFTEKNKKLDKIKIHNNPIGNSGFKLLINNIDFLEIYSEVYFSNMSIDDESVVLLANILDLFKDCWRINLEGNNIRMKGLKSICEKSLENEKYPFIQMKCPNWTNEELEYYLDYCIKKKRKKYDDKKNILSTVYANDSHIKLIKKIDSKELDLSNNRISFKGLKELTDSLNRNSEKLIKIDNNEIGDEGVEIICKYLDNFVSIKRERIRILKLLNIGMSEKGLKTLIERLKYYKLLNRINISGNELDEEGLKLMKNNKEVFDCLERLSITVKEDIKKNELKSFIETFSTIDKIKINGVNEKEKKDISKEFFKIK